MPSYAEFGRELKEYGCYFHHEGKEHEVWFSPITGQTFRMSRHKKQEVPRGTEHAIRKQAGVPKKR